MVDPLWNRGRKAVLLPNRSSPYFLFGGGGGGGAMGSHEPPRPVRARTLPAGHAANA